MAKEIEIEFERGGKFVARLLEEAAPETCRIVWDSLPIEGRVKHSIFSGQAFFILADFRIDTVENPARILQPGDLAFDTHFTPLVGSDNKPAPNEVVFIYGRDNMITDKPGIPTVANHFATIVNGDLNKFMEIGTRLRERGVEKVRLKRRH